LNVIVRRIVENYGKPDVEAIDEMVNVLFTLLSFECFDTLAGPLREIEEVTSVVQRLARAVLDLDDG
jgi:hypothetical protein